MNRGIVPVHFHRTRKYQNHRGLRLTRSETFGGVRSLHRELRFYGTTVPRLRIFLRDLYANASRIFPLRVSRTDGTNR